MKPLIATPSHGGVVCVNYLTSLVRLNPVPDIFIPSCSLITAGRNECVAKFTGGDWTHLFFIDSDVGFDPASFRRLLLSGHEISAGAYPFRSDDITDQGGFVVDPAEVKAIDEKGFATIENAPTGFMCIARAAIEKMRVAGIGRHEFFDTMRLGDDYLGEDHAFCKRWLDIGGKIHLDTLSNLTHQGTKVFQRNFSAVLRR